MALLSDQEVQLRISAVTSGEASVETLSATVDELKAELDAVAESAKKSGAAQADAANKLLAAKARMDDVKLALMSAKNEYKFLAERAKESGAAQSLFADQAAAAKTRLAGLNSELVVSRGNVRLAGDEHRNAARQTKALADESQRLAVQLKNVDAASLANSVGGLGGAFSKLNGVLATLGIGAVGEKFLSANLAADKLQKSLNAVNGDSVKTAADLDFLKETAQRLGINLESSAGAFVKLAAAAKGTSLEGETTRNVFAQIGGAMSKLGLSSAESERAFVAIAQMMSKGTVSAEELKGQLGDVLPGALQLAARATGLTTAELGKLMETGGLLTEDFLPKFAAEIEKSFGGASEEVQGLTNTIERTKNTWSAAAKIFGDTGFMATLAAVLGVVSEAFLLLATGVTAVVSAFFAFVKAISVTVAAIVTLDFSGLKAAFAEIGAELVGNIGKMASLTWTAKQVSEAINGTAQATKAAAVEVSSAKAGWEKLTSAFDQSAKSLADYTTQLKLVNKANDEQASLQVKLASLSGNENQLLIAKEAAARQAAAGATQLALAIENEAKALQAKVLALEEEAKSQSVVSAEHIKAIEAAKNLAAAKTEEAKAARSSADASRVAAAASEVESAARADNSQRVNELKTAYEEAAIKVDVLRAAQLSGIDVSAELTAAQLTAAKAANLYKDALADQTTSIQQNLAVKQSQLNIDQAGVRLAIEQQRSIYELAKARGDEYGATQALLDLKQLEIKLAELTAQAKRAEADAALLVAQSKREELKASGELTAAKEAELKAQEAAAKVKRLEADISAELASRMRDLFDQTQMNAQGAAAAAQSYDQLAESLGGVAGSADSAARAIDRVADANGKLSGSPSAGVDFTQLARDRGAKSSDLAAIQELAGNAYSDALAAAPGRANSSLGLKSLLSDAVDSAMGQLTTQQSVANAAANVAANQTRVQPSVVHLTIGTKTQPINVASPNDADQLVSMLRLLETARSVAVG